jgi:hypothetical protein
MNSSGEEGPLNYNPASGQFEPVGQAPPEEVPEDVPQAVVPVMLSEEALAGIMARLETLGMALGLVTSGLQAVTAAQVADRAAGRRTRQLAVGLGVSIVLDVVLTVVVTLLTLSALSQGETLHASQLANCASSNDTRAEQRQLWQYIFQLTGPPKTAAQKAGEQKFLAFVDLTFAPVNCTQAYK